jgi:O-antigen/teichoic acid export membrane protein
MGNPWSGLRNRVLESRAGRQISGTGLKARLIRGTGGTIMLRSSNVVLQFVISLALARLLSVDDYGVYNYALAWVMLLIVPAVSGFDRLLIRDTAIYRVQSAWSSIHGLLRFASRVTVVVAVLLMAAGMGIAWLTYEITGRPAMLNAEQAGLARVALYTLLIALALLPLRAVLLFQQAAMQGMHHIVPSQIPEQALQPILFVALIGGVYWLSGAARSAPRVMLLQIVATGAALACSAYLLRRAVPSAVRDTAPVFETRVWVHSAMLFALTRGFVTLNVQLDPVMLGALNSAEAVALFTVAQRGAQLVSVLLLSVNVALAPTLAQLYADGNRRDLQRTMTHSARLVVAGALPLTVFFVVWGTQFLHIFGAGFVRAHGALVLLSAGQLVNALTGSAGLLLLMTQHERAVTLVTAVSVVLHLLLNVLLIPRWGIEGAAVGGAVSTAFINLLMIGIVWRELRIHTTALGVIRWPARKRAVND